MSQSINELIGQAERIGVIGSPSSTSELAIDIMGTAVNKKLVGELALFKYSQDNLTNYALGQITEVSLRNIWHEDPTMRSLIRQRGRVDAVSERQDTHQGEMTVSAVFSDGTLGYKPSILGTVPATGTPIQLVDDQILDTLLSQYKKQLFYLGHVYGSTPKLPLWFKHFDKGPDGAGEAYHLGIFGKTGSGKSVLAKMILLAYARYPKMGLLVIDPQGEFAKEVRGDSVPGEFALPTKEILRRNNKPAHVFSVKNLILDRWDLFSQILFESPFFEKLSIPKGENRELASTELSDKLQKVKVQLKDLHLRASFDKAWSLLGEEKVQKVFYRTEPSRARFQSMLDEVDKDSFYAYWLAVAQLFRTDKRDAKKVEGLLYNLFDMSQENRPLVIVDLSTPPEMTKEKEKLGPLFSDLDDEIESTEETPSLWNETIQALVIKRLLEGIRFMAERAYQQSKSLNTLVMIDEAHRLAPREEPDNQELKSVRGIFIDAVRTTRKYGVGWMFISQTLSSLHREIIEQLRIFFFGFGLGMGAEFKALSELVGGRSKTLDLYQLFRDPHSSFDTASKEYSFMTIGPVSPLSFSGTPLFLNAFNRVDEFLDVNKMR